MLASAFMLGVLALGAVAGPSPAVADPYPFLKDVTAIAAGDVHTCVLLSDGKAQCWGFNFFGQLGNGTNIDSLTPVTVLRSPGGPPLTGIVGLAAGEHHTCALLSSGRSMCWGYNGNGQLGDGTTTDSPTPVTVRSPQGGPALQGIRAIAIDDGLSSCAVLTSGQARCWGNNAFGQLGDGTLTDSPLPVTVMSAPGGRALSNITQIAPGQSHTCARLGNGQARCWGNNAFGELGDGTTTDSPTPVTVLSAPGGPALTDVTSVGAGFIHSCALLGSGQARCWGFNDFGSLGDGTTTTSPSPVAVIGAQGGPPLTGITSLATGAYHACAKLGTGQTRCWGDNIFGALGDGTRAGPTPVPTTVLSSVDGSAFTGVSSLSAGSIHTCARMTNGRARCWGGNAVGQLGDGTMEDRLVPVPVLR